jgi:hypothetical protein
MNEYERVWTCNMNVMNVGHVFFCFIIIFFFWYNLFASMKKYLLILTCIILFKHARHSWHSYCSYICNYKALSDFCLQKNISVYWKYQPIGETTYDTCTMYWSASSSCHFLRLLHCFNNHMLIHTLYMYWSESSSRQEAILANFLI